MKPDTKTENLKTGKIRLIIDAAIMAVIFCFLLCYFEPHWFFSKTTTTGGDTGSHYFTAQYLADYLLLHGKISGWCQGSLGGYPMLQYYFPLPFLIMAVISLVVPLQIAFKLVTVLGIFLLPFCAYMFFRFLKQPFPVPITGAVFSLPFLFMEGNSMWGANIASVLAGQFCCSLGFSLSVLWLGLLYHTISEQKNYLKCSVLLAMIGLSHGYALIFVVSASSFFLVTKKRFGKNLKTLLLIHVTGFFLMAFWLLPLIAFLPDTTKYSIVWVFSSWEQIAREVFSPVIRPYIGLTLAAAVWIVIRKAKGLYSEPVKPWIYVWFLCGAGLVLYGIGYRMKVVDIRFIPFFQFFLAVGGVMIFASGLMQNLVGKNRVGKNIICGLTAFIVLFLTLLWVDGRETHIRNWIRSNYAGFEETKLWRPFLSVNRFLKGSVGDPRVAYEYSLINNGAGTVRAFENLPLFSGRSTLEGLQLPASLCVPFIFYLQSEISQTSSMPIPEYNYSRFNLERGIEHLKLFNVRELILVEPKTKEAIKEFPEFTLVFKAEPYEVYQLQTNSGKYVKALEYKPVLTSAKNWRKLSYRWFRLGDLSVPLVFKDKIDKSDRKRFNIVENPDVLHLPAEPLPRSSPFTETVREEEVLIKNAPVGKPLLIRIAYHPNWKVTGADRIYRASPAFMLIFPDSSDVRIYYGRTWPDYAGAVMTGLAILLIFISRFSFFKKIEIFLSRIFDRYGVNTALVLMCAFAVAAACYLLFSSPESPVLPYYKGVESFAEKDYSTAKDYFQYVLKKHPETIIADHAGYLYAVCFFKEKNWKKAAEALEQLLETYPETIKASEAGYHLGLCYQYTGEIKKAEKQYEKTRMQFSKEKWAGFAGDRLKEIRRQ